MSSDPIFQKSLQDIIKGIRNSKRDTASFISQTISEIKNELKSTDPFIKSEAVRKLTYLQMIGYNVNWASFSIIEVMSQTRFAHKRIGYLAANQIFDENTDVILLTTNLFKKELYSTNHYEAGLAMNCIANILNKDLARDCLPDLVTHLSHPKPYIRKKAVLAMYKLYLKYPTAIRHTFEKLKDCLEDSDVSVVSTAVNVICELANKNPRNYLPMAPQFFRLLTTSSNNWMLIKVVKLMTALVAEEPRLARKLLEPLATIIQNTGAKSLKYECIHAITEALPHSKREDGSEPRNYSAVIKLCSDYLRGFIEDNDQNLKYLGLVGLLNLLRSSPKSVVEHRDLILKCLNDEDVTIRIKALDLIVGIASKKSLIELVKHLLEQARRAEGTYRDEIITRILFVSKNNKYEMISDFAWYISVLLDLAVLQGSLHGREVALQLMEICLRVDSVRAYTVEQMLCLMLNDSLFFGQARETLSEVLKAAAWIVGEYSSIVTAIIVDNDNDPFYIEAPFGEEVRSIWRGQPLFEMLLGALLSPKTTNLSENIQTVYLHAAMKIFIRGCLDIDVSSISRAVQAIRTGLPVFLQNVNLEVQERATVFLQLLIELGILKDSTEGIWNEISENSPSDFIDTTSDVRSLTTKSDEVGAQAAIRHKALLRTIIAEPFYAVHMKAQRKVPIPEEIDIDTPFNQKAFKKLLDYDIDQSVSIQSVRFVQDSSLFKYSIEGKLDAEEEAVSQILKDGLLEEEDGRSNSQVASSSSNQFNQSIHQVDNFTDNVFNLSKSLKQPELLPLSKALAEGIQETLQENHSKKSKKKKPAVSIDRREMLPAGALSSDEEEKNRKMIKSKRSEFMEEDDESSLPISNELTQRDELLSGCRPYKLNQREMKKKLLSTAGVRLDQIVELKVAGEYDRVINGIQTLFRAHLVGGRADEGTAFLAAKFPSKVKLFLMLQFSRNENWTVEIRCIGEEASSVQTALTTSLNALKSLPR